MQRFLLLVQRLHLPLEVAHAVDHCVKGFEGGGGVGALEGGVGGGFEEGEDLLVLALEVFLGGFEGFAEQFLGEPEEGLVLIFFFNFGKCVSVCTWSWQMRGKGRWCVTRRRWLSWLSFVVVNSAAMLAFG